MKELIGKRILFKVNLPHCDGQVNEGVVGEISPSGKCVKIGRDWYEVEKVAVVEQLPEKPAKEAKAPKE